MIFFLNNVTYEVLAKMGKTPSYSDLGNHVAFVVSLWPEQMSQVLWVALKVPRILSSCVGVLYGMSFCLDSPSLLAGNSPAQPDLGSSQGTGTRPVKMSLANISQEQEVLLGVTVAREARCQRRASVLLLKP